MLSDLAFFPVLLIHAKSPPSIITTFFPSSNFECIRIRFSIHLDRAPGTSHPNSFNMIMYRALGMFSSPTSGKAVSSVSMLSVSSDASELVRLLK